MEIPLTILTLVETSIVGVLLGASTVAVISYALCLRHGYPREGIGNALIQGVYTLIRVFHVLLAIVVAVSIIVFGVFDGLLEAQVEYGVKASVLFINGLIACGMAYRILPVAYAAPFIAAGWYFLASCHTYTMDLTLISITTPVIWYLSLIILFQLIFILLRQTIKPISHTI